jgi:hypothetical protein
MWGGPTSVQPTGSFGPSKAGLLMRRSSASVPEPTYWIPKTGERLVFIGTRSNKVPADHPAQRRARIRRLSSALT